MANRVGRPTKYNPDLQMQAEYYLHNWHTDEIGDAIPSRVGLCCWIGIAKPTSFDWEQEYPEFSATLKAVEAMQERVAVNKGITGVFNSTITKLVLANHGYHDSVKQDNVSSDNSMSPKSAITISKSIDAKEAADLYREMMQQE